MHEFQNVQTEAKNGFASHMKIAKVSLEGSESLCYPFAIYTIIQKTHTSKNKKI